MRHGYHETRIDLARQLAERTVSNPCRPHVRVTTAIGEKHHIGLVRIYRNRLYLSGLSRDPAAAEGVFPRCTRDWELPDIGLGAHSADDQVSLSADIWRLV